MARKRKRKESTPAAVPDVPYYGKQNHNAQNVLNCETHSRWYLEKLLNEASSLDQELELPLEVQEVLLRKSKERLAPMLAELEQEISSNRPKDKDTAIAVIRSSPARL